MIGPSRMRPPFLALAALLAVWTHAASAQAPAGDGPAVDDPAPATPPKKPAPRKAVPAKPKAVAPPPAAGTPVTTPAALPPVPAAPRPDLTVACAEKAALYEGPKNFSVWVTRTGLIVVENPLLPLTPDSARVLQVVIAGKVATAYGPDLFALRRGGAPAVLEGAKGGTIRWDATPTPLPDTLNIVSEAGQPLAQLAFQACGEAPAVKAAPVAKSKSDPATAKSDAGKGDAGKSGSTRTATRPKTSKPPSGQTEAPSGVRMPAAAIEP
ncbi:hypothetical protein [Methylobacterium sp. J-090]|uniref:hypothetical protein n=1 Tax=Methylobacterium sp. J-090 TaxID=2836666 RepID=UPI001FBA0C2B|nr:hypothetical protein [Methylobacterium sp. J-090]MCJ2079731.1 hypothetical protein [Methylobacterium sp. J-090]